MCEFEKRDFYMQWLYRIAYKFYVLEPWKNRNYFDFFGLKYSSDGKILRYIVNFENYNTVSVKGDDMCTKTIWIHAIDDENADMHKLSAFCTVFTSLKDIPKKYLPEITKWKNQPFSDEFTPFFVDFSGVRPLPLDFESARTFYYLLNNLYGLMIKQKQRAAHF